MSLVTLETSARLKSSIIECFRHLVEFHVHIIYGDLDGLLHIFLIGDGDVHMLFNLARAFLQPEVLAVVKVARNRDTAFFRFLDGLIGKLHCTPIDSKCDVGDGGGFKR